MDQPKILILGDNEFVECLEFLPSLKSCACSHCIDFGSFKNKFLEDGYNLSLIDVGNASEDVLRELSNFDCELIFFSDGRPNKVLDELMCQGVIYHFRQPFDYEVIDEALKDCLSDIGTVPLRQKQALTSNLDQFGLLVGSSKVMRKLYRGIRRVSPTDANVLIVGESGTGKELVAQTVHAMSECCDGPYVAINCGALSPELIDSELFGHVKGAFTGAHKDHQGVFEQAAGGTLFLDEITEMPIELQVKLLRVLQQEEYKPVGSERTLSTHVRIIAATNRDPFKAIEQGQLREDLYFRLAQFPIEVPPLRVRQQDVLGLAFHFIAYLNDEAKLAKQLDQETINKIEAYNWPGNVRELKHSIERAYILSQSDTIQAKDLELSLPTDGSAEHDNIPAGVPLKEIERIAIEKTLEDNNGNKKETAEQLGVSVKTLYNKIDKYN